MDALAARLDTLPTEPGVYLFKDSRGRVLYVGKAKSLKSRVKQYFSGHDGRVMIPFLVRAAADVEVVVVRTEKEALILENTLIKKHEPRYNTKLVDDTNFLHLRIDPAGRWPRYGVVRGVSDKHARHFGPYTSASRARATLEFLSRRFPLRTCTDRELESRKRPCLLHQMHRCLAPCVNLCTQAEYSEVVEQSMLFLEGRNRELIDRLTEQMMALAEAEDFEAAARVRDLVRAIEVSVERQQVKDLRGGDRDAWGVFREGEGGVVTLMPVRGGALQESVNLPFDAVVEDDGELLSSMINHWYQEGAHFPDEILTSAPLHDAAALGELLRERGGGAAIDLRCPEDEAGSSLARLAADNARAAWIRHKAAADRSQRAMDELMRAAHLPKLPRRIECFDNSNIQGTDPVASMVVFVDGVPAKAEYRRYKVKEVVGADDYATMREILGRRFRRALEDGVFPDLLVVDGGKGQLSVATAVLAELGLSHVPAIGLAKPRTERARGDRDTPDKIVLPNAKNPIVLKPNSPALHLLQALRDETHRTAVRYHRKVRDRRALTSALESLPGVGKLRSRALLKHFGGLTRMREATPAQIAEVPGIGEELASTIAAWLSKPAEDSQSS